MRENLKLGSYYYLYNLGEDRPILAYYYLPFNEGEVGFGFNTADGGGFLPLWDLTEDTTLIPVKIVEVHSE